MNHRTHRAEAGMTLIEVITSVAILVSAVLSLAAVSTASHRLRRTVLEKNIVLEVVEAEKSAIRATDFDELIATHHGRDFEIRTDDEDNPRLSAWSDDDDAQPGEVRVAVLREIDGQPALLQITLEVAWRGVSGRQSIRREFQISRLGAS